MESDPQRPDQPNEAPGANDIEPPGQVPPEEPANPFENDPVEDDTDDVDYDATQDEPGDQTADDEALGAQERAAMEDPNVGEGTPDTAPERTPSNPPPVPTDGDDYVEGV